MVSLILITFTLKNKDKMLFEKYISHDRDSWSMILFLL